MPKAITMALRKTILAERQQGKTLRELAVLHQVSYTTVQTLCARWQEQGEAGLKPAYDRCGKPRPGPGNFLFRTVRCFKCWHPGWGAAKIRTELLLLRPQLAAPSVRTIQQWFHYAQQVKVRNRVPRQEPPWAKATHEVWQVDAKEEMLTRDGTMNCWLNITDEYSGAVIDPPVFPPA